MIHKNKSVSSKNNNHMKKIFIDWETVDKYLQAGASGAYCANKIGVHENTLFKRTKKDKGMDFSEYKRIQKCFGDDNLRIKKYFEAMKGNVALLIWEGKQRLGESDKVENKNDIKLNGGLSIFELMQKENESENTDKTKSK